MTPSSLFKPERSQFRAGRSVIRVMNASNPQPFGDPDEHGRSWLRYAQQGTFSSLFPGNYWLVSWLESVSSWSRTAAVFGNNVVTGNTLIMWLSFAPCIESKVWRWNGGPCGKFADFHKAVPRPHHIDPAVSCGRYQPPDATGSPLVP